MGNTHANAECVSSSQITGADIPEELFKDILRHATESLWKPNARYNSSLALTCRYFAKICRPNIYRDVKLRSRKQLRRLIDLNEVSGPLGWLLVLTEVLHIEPDNDDTLWVHQVATVLVPRLSRAGGRSFREVQLRIDKLLPGIIPFRAQLPRTLPCSLLQHITHLSLRSVRFESGDDLLQCLSPFRNLEKVDLPACTCGMAATPATSTRFPLNHRCIWVWTDEESCFETALPAALDACARRDTFLWLSIGGENHQALKNMSRSLLDYAKSSRRTLWPEFWIKTSTTIDLHAEFGAFDFDLNLKPVLGAREQFDCIIKIQESQLGGDVLDTLDFWHQLASCIICFENLRELSFEFEKTYFAREIMKVVRPAMQDIYASLGHRLVVSPSGPPKMPMDHKEYPYLARIPYPSAGKPAEPNLPEGEVALQT